MASQHKQFLNSNELLNDIALFFKKMTVPIVQSLVRTFAVEASKYTPPGSKTKRLGSAYIGKEYYSRPIQQFKLLHQGAYKGFHMTKKDYQMWRQGYKFRVLNTKYGVKKGTVYAYTKGINEAKRVARIQNRGLSKYSWSGIITNFSGIRTEGGNGFYNAELPPAFKRLAKESPNITKYTWSSIYTDASDIKNGRMSFLITNTLTDIERYGQIAIRRGTQALLKQWNKMQKDIENKQTKRLQKFLDFEINKFNIGKK